MAQNAGLSWYALHTKAGQEARAVANLNAWGIETCAAWINSRTRWHDQTPLFPRYIFAHFDVTRMLHKVCFTRGICYIVSFGGVSAVVDDDVITVIQSRIDQDGLVMPPNDLKPGDLVSIRSGSWANMMGCFEKRMRGSDRVRILLKSFSYNARVEIPSSEVIRLTDSLAS
jgi:transcriptional antiterminator RfaH